MKYEVLVSGKKYEVDVKEVGFNVFEVVVNGKKALIELEVKTEIKKPKEEVKVVKKEVAEVKVEKKIEGKVIAAPMNGIVTKILVKVGDKVKEGDVLLIVEAMKMENPVKSPFSGTVKNILVKEGDKVLKEAPLVVLE
ncbi:MAG: biotin/lipoyl-binding protein [Archaeoglobaceae archaeon]|nr:biotin/lipoyl-binding protein [Archaeoglobaceae archaeon]MCX8151538.1 biotin/lipoyl-binding protein [Archaeoglobaceae archaeon]MDW8013226.1 biotin/lipoyl-containing protein [Archaeoglobaceae archaeon]